MSVTSLASRDGEQNLASKTVDTTKKITVETQFKTVDNTNTGALSEIGCVYVQNGVVTQNTKVNIPGMQPYDSITAPFCKAQKIAFNNTDSFSAVGGFTAIDEAFTNGVVLVINYPTDVEPATHPRVARGTCATTSGVPAQLEATSPNPSVTYSNIKFGPIGSTYPSDGTLTSSSSSSSRPTSSSSTHSSSTSSTRSSSSSSSQSGGVAHWAQCGSIGWTGATSCVSPFTCTKLNDWYFQSL